MAGNLHDVIDIHSSQVHQGGSGSSRRVRVDQFILFIFDCGFGAAFGLDHLYYFCETGHLADFFDVAVDDLVGQVGHLVVVALQDILEPGGARDCDLGTGLMPPDVDVHYLTGLDLGLGLARVLRIRNVNDGALGIGLDGVVGDIVVVRDALGSPAANEEDVAGLLVADGPFACVDDRCRS